LNAGYSSSEDAFLVISSNENEQLETTIIESVQDFRALEEEWEELYQDSPLATPFQSWAWLYSWWEFYGEGWELQLITVRNGEGLLVGVAPLMLDRRLGFSRLFLVGTGLTDYLDVLAREGWEGKVVDALAQALRQMVSWQLADLQQLRPDAVAWDLCRRWDGPHLRIWQDGFPFVDTKPWDELLASIDRKLRSNARRTLRRAKEDNVVCKLAEPADAERAARRLVEMHREMWQGRDIGLEHLTSRFEAHVVAAAARLTACGLGGVYEFRRGEETIAAHFLLFGPSFIGEYMFGVTHEARRRFQVSSLNMWNLINVACRRGSARVTQLRGEEAYKLQWASEVIPNHRLILCRRWATWGFYGSYHILRSKARRYVLSDSAPRWVESAANIFRMARRIAAQYTGRGNRT
jgi:CelD/BcsL family acetyltransferase involved in cellulose biosynthesis